MNKYRVGIYLRLSKEDEDSKESGSITNQRSILMNYIQEQKLEYVEEYVDDGVSGLTFQRKGFQKMIQDIENKKINMVITKDTSRLGRDHIEFGYYVEKYFPEHNVRYVAVCDQIDTASSNNDMLLFKSAYNDMYVKDISNKIRSSLNIKKRNGEFVGAYAPYGYKKDPLDKHKLIIDEESSTTVKRIFQLFIEGNSITKIANILTQDQILIPSIYQGMNRGLKSKLFGIWTQRTITDILTNPTYIGNLTQGRSKKINYKSKKRIHTKKEEWIIKENSCPAIIEEDIFHLANHIYHSNKYRYQNQTSNNFLLKGLVYCAECQHTIGFRRVKTSTTEHIYGNCNYYLKHRTQKVCTPHKINYFILENIILKTITQELKKVNLEKIFLKIQNTSIQKELNKYQKEITYLEKTIATNHQKIDLIYEDKLNHIIDNEQYLRISNKIKKENTKYQEQIINLTKKNEHFQKINYQKQLKKIRNTYQIDRLLISTLVEKITITENKEIHIYYKVSSL